MIDPNDMVTVDLESWLDLHWDSHPAPLDAPDAAQAAADRALFERYRYLLEAA